MVLRYIGIRKLTDWEARARREPLTLLSAQGVSGRRVAKFRARGGFALEPVANIASHSPPSFLQQQFFSVSVTTSNILSTCTQYGASIQIKMFDLRTKVFSTLKQFFAISDSTIYRSDVLGLWPVQLHILPDHNTWIDYELEHPKLPA